MSNTAIAATLVAYIGGFIVCLCIWYLFFRKKPFLTFDMLTDAEQDQYNTYANQIDDALLQKFIKRLPVKFAIWTIVAVATGTIGIPILFALRWMFRVAKNDRARSYIVQLHKKYNCKEINWETFPAHSVVLGEKRKAGSDSCGQLCPICQTHSLYRSFLNERREMWTCNFCNKNIVLKYSSATGRPETIVIPGASVLMLAIPATGVIGDIVNSLPEHTESAMDVIGTLFEALF